jgi:integrase
MVHVCAHLVLRWEEVSALRPSDLDLERTAATVTVRGWGLERYCFEIAVGTSRAGANAYEPR